MTVIHRAKPFTTRLSEESVDDLAIPEEQLANVRPSQQTYDAASNGAFSTLSKKNSEQYSVSFTI